MPVAYGPALRGNDYGPLAPPAGDPRLSVSVVVPAHGHQDKLDVTLASLAAQTYPAGLLEVVVVDDGTEPPLRLPEVRPERTRIVAPLPGGWSSAHATNSGVAQSDGDVVLRLDADMLVFHDHVASQLRWHHAADYLAVLGHKRFVDYAPGVLEPAAVYESVRAGEAASLFDAERSEPQWIEQIIDATDRLRQADHRAFRVMVGASFSVTRAMFRASGGMDADVPLGSDTIFGYRLHQAGALFVPDDGSSAWHLGPRQIAERGALAKRYRRPRIANRVPELDVKRPRAARGWATPLADVVVEAGDDAAETESCVDAILGGSVPDVRVTLVGDWPEPPTGRHAVLDDPELEARLLLESFRGESRVRFAAKAEADPTVPYVIRVPAAARPGPEAVAALVEYANRHRLGLVELALPEGAISLERTAAAARAAHLGVGIDAVWGRARLADGPLAEAFSAAASAAGDARGGGQGGLRRKARGVVRRALGR
ncbi:glycosyltransferase [Glycomyces sp. TRM65418]|uniref:glycosyltransferase family 2 protein n=1 Tax=Glycomyces sp. TRM65418 TaxID=2867006 RepID=UPI001CE5A807|nr:glycosyltransferase family 2 protein [Glycomyces sp. TRM65418]MCC3762749.1 glycosyltransferase [Glycomyces sp. TRM65418]QZD56780.1 glycosyltransferase [Glycomyces sp. TRM65418]